MIPESEAWSRRGAGSLSTPAWGTRVTPASLPGTTQLPGYVHAKVGKAVAMKGEEKAQDPGWLLGALGSFFIEAFIYLFIYYSWGLTPPPPSARACPSGGRYILCLGVEALYWEEGQGTLTGPLSKATKVLLVPIPKPKAV